MPQTYITINKHKILGNLKHGKNDPPIRVARTKSAKPIYGHGVQVHGPVEILYMPDEPLKCGARVYLRTKAEVTIWTEKEKEHGYDLNEIRAHV